jgi:hypothetical protein
MTTWRDHVARARLSLPFVQDFPIKMNVFANCQNMLLAGSLGWLLTSSSQGGFEPWSGMTVAGSSSYLFTVWAMRRLCAFPNRFKLSYCVRSSILNMLGIWKSVCSASKLNWPLLVYFMCSFIITNRTGHSTSGVPCLWYGHAKLPRNFLLGHELLGRKKWIRMHWSVDISSAWGKLFRHQCEKGAFRGLLWPFLCRISL